MKYIKTYESLREEYPDFYPPLKPEDLPKSVPGFESGTIDPEDTDPWKFNDETHEAESERYKDFLKIVKERNFIDTGDEIIINLKGISQDYCMSIHNFPKHLKKFLEDELIDKYISEGLIDLMSDNYTQVQGIIKKILLHFIDSHDCSATIDFKVYPKQHHTANNTVALNTIKIDKLKSNVNKYNL